jgi:transposase
MRVIAKRLSMSRNTVRRIVGRGSAKKKTAPAPPRTSLLAPYEARVKALLDDTPELTGPAVLEKLRADGYRGGISILSDKLRTLRPREAEPFLTLDFKPGEAVQVDWADFGFALPGIPRRVSGFVMATNSTRHARASIASANSHERAMMVCCGLTPRLVGITDASATTRPS